MKDTDAVLVTAIYHPKPGYERDFINFWQNKIKKIILDSGASWASMYHNEETEEFLCTSYWKTMAAAQNFLNSDSYQKELNNLNKLSLIPPSRVINDILREAA